MGLYENLLLVFVAGLITDLATGLGALPFFLVSEINDRWNVALWGLASGIMLSASVFGLLREGLLLGGVLGVAVGVVVGALLVIVSHRIISGAGLESDQFEAADFSKLVLILGILTVHSFPEGVAIGVSFGQLDLAGVEGLHLAGYVVPLLAVFMTVAISIHNIPEGVAISIPLKSMGVSKWRMVWWSIFSSLPQPIGAVIAFAFVSVAQQFLPFGFGFAAGAMIYLVLTEFIPEALELGEGLPGRARRELVGGLAIGVALMLPLIFI